jgi:hypothetical protein
MFAMLTTTQLYDLHGSLCTQITDVHQRMLLASTWTPEYQLMKAHASELHETASAVYAETVRRDQENTSALH